MTFPNLSAFAVREQAITLFLIIAIAVAGTFAFTRLGRAEDPSFTVKAMTIAAAWPGATAEEMETQVADRMEKRLQELRYFDKVETLSRPGLVFLTLQLRDDIPPAQAPGAILPGAKEGVDEAAFLPQGVLGPCSTTNIPTSISRSTRCRRPACRTASSSAKPKACASGCSACPASRRSISWASRPRRSSSNSPISGSPPSA
jgi:hypothetical protein